MTPVKSAVRLCMALLALALGVGGLLTAPARAYIAMVPGSNPTPKLHVTGRFLQDPNGNNVLLHGWYQPAQSYFNGGGHNYPDPTNYADPNNVAPALNFLEGEADIYAHQYPLYGAYHGWYCSFVRLNGTNNNNSFAPGWDSNGNLTDRNQFQGWLNNFVIPYINHCRQDGLYVVLLGTPSQSYPNGDASNNMTQAYQQSLVQFWQIVASTPGIKSANNVQFELCNEPIKIETSFNNGQWGNGDDAHWSALTNFLQPIVNTIRQQNADNLIWVPGLGYQAQYQGFVNHPIKGGNVGYAAHFYPGYVRNLGDPNAPSNVASYWNANYKPCADQYPMMITEMYWQNYTNDQLYDQFGHQTYAWLFYGITGNGGYGFGTASRNVLDAEGNVSYLIGGGDPLLDLSGGLQNGSAPVQGNDGDQAAFNWFPDYGANGSSHSTPTSPAGPAEGVYSLSPADNLGLSLDVYGGGSSPGTPMWQWYNNTTGGQRFYFHPVGDNLYWLEPQNAHGDALDVYQINPNNGASLDIWPNYGNINQLWYVIDLHNGTYRLAPDLNPTQTLDQPGANTAPCALQTYSYSAGQQNQQWVLTRH